MKTKPETREYQSQAITAFSENHYRGIFEMATGTGKTITSLFAVEKCRESSTGFAVVILVPFIHLVDQWENEIKRFTTLHKIIKCYGQSKQWLYPLEDYIDKLNAQRTDLFFIISTYRTAVSDNFQSKLKEIRGDTFLIADECHYFGSEKMKLTDLSYIPYRLGLSATPSRWWDEDGTSHIMEYFEKTVYEFPIQKAIELDFLTPYKYYPVLVTLIESEVEKYNELTLKIVRLMNSEKLEDLEKAKDLAILRRRILTNAAHKKDVFKKLLEELDSTSSHILVYCGPTEIDEVMELVSNQGFTVNRFDQELNVKVRKQVLHEFDKGNIQILVAIKCLDEGVDVPSTETAYFLASTTNPKEFIQRRGRVLRKSEGKKFANIIDFVVAPTDREADFFEDIVRKELPRVAEFSDYAINKYESRRELWDILKPYNLEFLLNKKSWEVYYENKLERELNLL